MRRRAAIGWGIAWPLAGRAQRKPKQVRIGLLGQGIVEPFVVKELTAGLRAVGRDNASDIRFEERWTLDRWEQLPGQAAELVALGVDLIVVHGDSPAVKAAMAATRTIPIFFLWIGDPVGQGLVQSLRHPGGNVTGLSFLGPEVELKRLELLKQAVPSITHIAVLTNPDTPDLGKPLAMMQAASRGLGVELAVFEVRAAGDLPGVLEQVALAKVDGLLVQEDFVLDHLIKAKDSAVAAFALRHRLPLAAAGMADKGVLVSYAFDWDAHFRQAARLIDKLLKGARPADIPIEQPSRFELAIDLKTARALGITVPRSMLLRADKVID